MPGRVHVHLEEQLVAPGLDGAQLRHPLGRLPVHHLAVVVAGAHQHGRVRLSGDVVVRAVGTDVRVLVGLLRVAPLLELRHRQGQRLVEHGVDHVDEGNVDQRRLEEVGPLVEDRAHEQAAGAAAADGEPVLRGVALLHQVLGAGDEVAERVLLVQHAAGVVPLLAHLAAAADVRDGDGHAAVHQREAIGIEGVGKGEAVGAVADEEQRALAVAPRGLRVQDGHRHLRATFRRREDALELIAGGIVPRHRLLLEQLALLRRHVHVVDRLRRHQRLVGDAVGGLVELRVVLGRHLVVGLREGEPLRLAGLEADDGDLRQPALALVADEEVLEDVDVAEHDVLAVRDHLRPVLLARRPYRRGHQAEVAPARVGADVEEAAAVVDVVLVVLLARLDDDQVGVRIAGAEEAHLAGSVALGGDEDEVPAPRTFNRQVEHLVLLLEGGIVFGRAEPVAPELVGPLGLRVLGHVEERLAVAGPGEAVDARDVLGAESAAAQVLQVQVVLPEARLVGGVGEERAVVARRPAAQGEELLALGHLVELEQHLLGRLERAGLAAEDGVLLSLLGARVIEEAADAEGDVDVGLLHAREHLRVELVLQRRRGTHHRVGVGGLGAQVRLHLRRAFLAQPEIVVDALVAVDGDVLRLPRRDGRLRHLLAGSGLRRARHAAGESEGRDQRTTHRCGPPGRGHRAGRFPRRCVL